MKSVGGNKLFPYKRKYLQISIARKSGAFL